MVATAKKSSKSSKPTRVEILGHSATSVIKWMGRKGWGMDRARPAVEKLASGKVADSTIATALSDGRNAKYNANAAKLSKDEQKKLAAAAKTN